MTVAERVAREAGRLIHQGRPERVAVAATKTSPEDVVTAMDLASEELLRRRLAELRPHDGVLGEEQGYVLGTSGVTWVVDPIDGTVNYLYGLPAYAVSVAAVVGPPGDDGRAPGPATWTVVAACVHAPTDGRTFRAGLGLGATLDGRTLRAEEPPPLAGCLLGTGFGYLATRRRAQARVLAELLPRVRDIRRIGSAALDICNLAAGHLDLYYERGLAPWDLAAASLVAQEAGLQVTGLRGRPAGTDMTVAGGAARVAELRSILESLDADTDG
ncbi:inositol monophosphatase family protein [Cellulomonas fimi]|uniref:inositol monophosphatase family protein n=1 Tax=Cellulomonas fimi TaxID=1708 RepID=UPI002358193F|nr:inositol monophosphatase family protein [Cellulomonas fimi]